MDTVIVLITLREGAIEQIKSNPEIAQREMQFVNTWKEEGILDSFFISKSKKGAVLIFKGDDEIQTKSLIESLPYFPFMSTIEYHSSVKQF